MGSDFERAKREKGIELRPTAVPNTVEFFINDLLDDFMLSIEIRRFD
jgi:hypothetical protein